MYLSPEELQAFALSDIDRMLQSNNRSLNEFPTMPQVDPSLVTSSGNRPIIDELNYDKQSLELEYVHLLSTMMSE